VRHLPPCAWWNLTERSVVLIGAVPRAVLDVQLTWNCGAVSAVTAFVEGMPPIDVTGTHAQPVELDESDAIGTLHASGLNPAPIEENAS
jgi:hypothetical protein